MIELYDVGARLYRTPSEIRRDIAQVRERMAVLRQQLDIRDMVVASLQDLSDTASAVRVLERIVDEAREALTAMTRLEEELTLLREELYELKAMEGGVR